MSTLRDLLAPTDTFARRHTGDNAADTAAMLALLGQPRSTPSPTPPSRRTSAAAR
jgi:hypothetical protein